MSCARPDLWGDPGNSDNGGPERVNCGPDSKPCWAEIGDTPPPSTVRPGLSRLRPMQPNRAGLTLELQIKMHSIVSTEWEVGPPKASTRKSRPGDFHGSRSDDFVGRSHARR